MFSLFASLLHPRKRNTFLFRYADALRFRRRIAVITAQYMRSPEQMIFYPVCPQCRRSIPREYQNYCCSCGQALSWAEYDDGEDEELP